MSAVPDSLPLANAAVLPLSLSTAAAGLFVDLDLPLPSLNPQKCVDKKILIWGGSSSCGSSAIQLAVAAGYTVATTASAANHDYVKALGADDELVFDHHDPDVEERIAAVLAPGDVILDCIADEKTQTTCGKILDKIGGGTLPLLLPPIGPFPESVKAVGSKHFISQYHAWAERPSMWILLTLGDPMYSTRSRCGLCSAACRRCGVEKVHFRSPGAGEVSGKAGSLRPERRVGEGTGRH